MRQAKWLQEGVALGNQFHYRKKNPWIHNTLNISLMLLVLAATVGMLYASVLLPALVYVPLAAVGVGIAFFSLVILVIHEASHNMFVVSKSRERAKFWNRFFGWMISIPFGINYLRHWEEGHHTHHIHPVEPDDPQTVNLWTGNRFVREFLLMVFVPGYVFLWNPSRQYKTQRWLQPANLGFWGVTMYLMGTYWSWLAPLVVLLGLGVTGALNQVKGSLEHGGEIATEENRNLRSRTSLFPGRHLIMPLNISLHFEHHLNYCVPWYDLPRYQRAILAIMPEPLKPQIFNTRIVDQLMGRIGKLTDDVRPLVEG